MKKILLLLLISIGLIGIYSDYKLAEKKAAQEMMAEIEEELARQAALATLKYASQRLSNCLPI